MADKKTSEETASGVIADADSFRGVQGGTNVRVLFSQVRTWLSGFVPFLSATNSFLGTNIFTVQTLFAPIATAAFVTRFSTTNITPVKQVLNTTDAGTADLVARFSNDSSGPRRFFAKSRNATVGSHTIVQSADVLGAIHWGGSDGTNILDAASMAALVASAPAANNMPTNLKFYNNRGAATVTYSFGAWSNGFVAINADVTPDAALTINNNTAVGVAPLAGSALHILGIDATAISIDVDGYGGNPAFRGRRAAGTQAAKTAAVAGNALCTFEAQGWDTAAYASGANIVVNARETFSGTARGSSLSLSTTPLTTANPVEAVRVQPSGGLSIGATAIATDPGAGNLNLDAAVRLGTFTVATLPAGVNGKVVYCSNGRMYNGAGTLEGAGVGTGGLVSYNGAWKIVGTNQTVQA